MNEMQTGTIEEQGKPGASHILVVDDNPEIREVIHLLLGGEGYEVTEAANGEQAIEASAQYAFDLIILDIMMPGMNGYQTCVEIRKNSNAPILFLSAKSQEDDKTLGFSSGGDDYLVKPFSFCLWRRKLQDYPFTTQMWHKRQVVIMYEFYIQYLCKMTFLHNRGIMCRKSA